MSVTSIGGASGLAIQTLVQMRSQLNDLQRQISTGQKSDTYAGLGIDRGLTVSLRSQLANMTAFNDTIDNVMTRVNLTQTALGRISDIGRTTKSSLTQANYATNTSGQATAHAVALSSLDELISLMNTQAGDRYLFSGRDTDTPAVDSMDHILNGNGSQAGLKQLIGERNQADLGASGLGRLVISAPTATSVAISEDAVSPFGLKLASVSTTLGGATVSAPTGTPAGLSVDLASVPNAGETFTVRFNLPDGSSENLILTATTDTPPGANQFSIGGSAAATAANLQTALTGALGNLCTTSLAAASAIAAANDFFDTDSANPPQRVDGPPFDSATALKNGTASDTVSWYTGEAGTDAARPTATARIDPTLTVSYGARANEDGIRTVLKNIAVLAAMDYSPGDPNAGLRSSALNTRLGANLDSTSNQAIVKMQAELAGAQTSMNSAKHRHQQSAAALADFLQQISGVSNEDVGVQILALQTRLQASLQTTALLYKTSLVNYL